MVMPVANPKAENTVRKELAELLRGGNAHAPFQSVVKNFSPKLRGEVPQGLPYSAWQVVEHIRIAQDDILRFSLNRDGGYKPLKWPQDYWSKSAKPQNAEAWNTSIRQVEEDCGSMIKLIEDPANDLYTPFPWGEGQNLLREALLVADHTSHHLGELIVLRRLLGAWPPD